MSEQNPNNSAEKRKPPPGGWPSQKREVPFSRFFKHWRNGKTYDAWTYGYKAWPLGAKR